MFRRDFLKRTTAASALLGSTGVAAARRRRHGPVGSEAAIRSFQRSGGTDPDADDEADVTIGDSTVVVEGTVGSLVDCASVGRPSVDYRDGELHLEVPYRNATCSDERRRRSIVADAYRARVDVPSVPEVVVVEHVHADGAEPGWHFRTDEDVAYEVEFESLGTTSDYEDRADVSFHGDRIEVEGVVSEGACSIADVTGVEYGTDLRVPVDRLVLSVDAVDRPNSGDVCITALRGVEYRATIRVPDKAPEFTLVHNDDWTAEPGRVTVG